jgi:hypothetical protein
MDTHAESSSCGQEMTLTIHQGGRRATHIYRSHQPVDTRPEVILRPLTKRNGRQQEVISSKGKTNPGSVCARPVNTLTGARATKNINLSLLMPQVLQKSHVCVCLSHPARQLSSDRTDHVPHLMPLMYHNCSTHLGLTRWGPATP